MKKYKIEYKDKEALIIDSEWFEWNSYDNIYYNDYLVAESIMKDAREQFPEKDWRVEEYEYK